MSKPLLHITAESKSGKRLDLYFYSERQARYLNPGLKHFRTVEEARIGERRGNYDN